MLLYIIQVVQYTLNFDIELHGRRHQLLPYKFIDQNTAQKEEGSISSDYPPLIYNSGTTSMLDIYLAKAKWTMNHHGFVPGCHFILHPILNAENKLSAYYIDVNLVKIF